MFHLLLNLRRRSGNHHLRNWSPGRGRSRIRGRHLGGRRRCRRGHRDRCGNRCSNWSRSGRRKRSHSGRSGSRSRSRSSLGLYWYRRILSNLRVLTIWIVIPLACARSRIVWRLCCRNRWHDGGTVDVVVCVVCDRNGRLLSILGCGKRREVGRYG